MKPCLKCGKKFKVMYPFNRICPQCQEVNKKQPKINLDSSSISRDGHVVRKSINSNEY